MDHFGRNWRRCVSRRETVSLGTLLSSSTMPSFCSSFCLFDPNDQQFMHYSQPLQYSSDLQLPSARYLGHRNALLDWRRRLGPKPSTRECFPATRQGTARSCSSCGRADRPATTSSESIWAHLTAGCVTDAFNDCIAMDAP